MGKRIMDNFKKRFGDPPNIEIVFAKKPLDSFEKRHRNKKIFDAYIAILRSILGREPTKAELAGWVDISKVKKKIKIIKPAVDYQI